MTNKKRNLIRAAVATVGAAVLTGAFILISSNAKADDETAGKKKLVDCSITQGGVVIKKGNTCDSGGDGCSPNPCQ